MINYAANLVLFGHDYHGTPHVLTVTRNGKAFPGKQCLPGGHVEDGERGREAALRECLEETGFDASQHGVRQVYFDDDPGEVAGRGRYIVVAYGRELPDYGLPEVKACSDDVQSAQWVPLSDLDLIFDHNQIVSVARSKLGVVTWPPPQRGISDFLSEYH